MVAEVVFMEVVAASTGVEADIMAALRIAEGGT